MNNINQEVHSKERGFILPTSLVMLVLLTMLSIATYYGTIISQQTSATAQDSTQAFYYAETGLNYVAWAMKNDAEFDGYSYVSGIPPVYEPMQRKDIYGAVVLNPYAAGDRREWDAARGHPSSLQVIQPVFNSGQKPDVKGQLAYFDNRDLYSRPVALEGDAVAGSDIYTFGKKGDPTFRDLYTYLGGYIRLDIDSYGTIIPSFSPYVDGATVQHGNNAHTCVGGQAVGDVPCDGAIVWVTGGDPYTDKVLYPIDPTLAAPFLDVYSNRLFPTTLLATGAGSCVVDMKACNAGVQLFPALQSTCATSLGGNCNTPQLANNSDVYSGATQEKMLVVDSVPAYYQGIPCDLSIFNKSDIACQQPINPANGQLADGIGVWLNNKDGDSTNNYNLVIYAIGYSGGKARKMIRMMIQL